MSIFGQKCDRCGVRKRGESDGVPLCTDCQEEVKLMVKAAVESPRLCPIDASPMEKHVAHSIVLDRCPRCQGVWLDGGELEKVREGVYSQTMGAMAAAFPRVV